MLDLVLKLIDRILDLTKRHEEQNRLLFDRFVLPAFTDFEELHKRYVESLLEYRQTIRASHHKLDLSHPVLDKIAIDRLASMHLKTRLSSHDIALADERTQAFASALCFYLHGNNRVHLTDNEIPPTPMSTTKMRLIDVFSVVVSHFSKKRAALTGVSSVMHDIQERYKWSPYIEQRKSHCSNPQRQSESVIHSERGHREGNSLVPPQAKRGCVVRGFGIDRHSSRIGMDADVIFILPKS